MRAGVKPGPQCLSAGILPQVGEEGEGEGGGGGGGGGEEGGGTDGRERGRRGRGRRVSERGRKREKDKVISVTINYTVVISGNTRIVSLQQ